MQMSAYWNKKKFDLHIQTKHYINHVTKCLQKLFITLFTFMAHKWVYSSIWVQLTIIITHISITPSAFHSIKTKKALQIDTRYKTTWPLCFSIGVCDVPLLQGSPETRSQLFMIQELISLSESSRKKRSSWKKSAEGEGWGSNAIQDLFKSPS